MKVDVLLQNFFYLFIIALILKISVTAVFKLPILREYTENKIVRTIMYVSIFGFSLLICLNVSTITLFSGTGIRLGGAKLNKWLDPIVSSLVVTGVAIFIDEIIQKIKENG